MGWVLTSSRCALHAPPGFPERPERLEAVLAGARAAGWEIGEAGEHAERRAAIEALHSPAYVERFERAVTRGDGLLDSADNPLSPGTFEAAAAAVDCVLTAVDWLAAVPGRQALAAVRPPGHHAERELAMGFCFFGNVAIAAADLVGRHGCERVAVVDFDVHHGNGTQHLLERRGDVLFASVHQYPFYPGSGAASEVGIGDGEGYTINVPLPAGTDDETFQRAVADRILSAVDGFEPQVLLVSAGFDGWFRDPIGGWALTDVSYGWLGRRLGELAARHCEGRILTVLEGGYSLEGLRELTRSYLEGVDREVGGRPV